MSNLIDSIVTLDTAINEVTASTSNFGEVLFVKEFSPFAPASAFQGNEERHRKYTSLDAIIDDGWEAGSDVYEAGVAFFAQENNTGVLVLGRKDEADEDYTATLNAISDEYGSFYGVCVCYTEDDLATSASYKQALFDVATWVDANKKVSVHATADAGCINKSVVKSKGYVVSGFIAEIALWNEVTAGSITISVDGATATETTGLDFSEADTLADVVLVLSTAITSVDITLVGNKIKFESSTEGKTSSVDITAGVTGTSIYSLLGMEYSDSLMGFDAGSTPNGTTTVEGNADLFTFLSAQGFERTMAVYNPLEIDGQHVSRDEAEWFGVGDLSDGFSYDPASQTWAYKSINGVTPTDIDSKILAFISDKSIPRYGNIYTSIKGKNVLLYGRTVDNTPMDVIRGIDWLDDLIQTNLFTLLTLQDDGSRKIPATDAGICQAESNLLATLGTASKNLLDETTIKVTVPLLADTDEDDRKARILTGITWEARLQGAYEHIKIEGRLSF